MRLRPPLKPLKAVAALAIGAAIAANAGLADKPVWSPIPNSSQSIALDTRCHHTLYHGARGPGKTITQLMRFRRRVGIGYGSFWRGVIFDREFKNLADLVAQSKRFFYKYNDGAKFLESASEYKWTWPTGEELLFRHVKKESDYDGFHGHEYPFIGWNELTKWPTPALYDKFCSTNRSSFRPEDYPQVKTDAEGREVVEYLPPIPLEVFSTTNPSGPGHNWVKARFINVAANGVVVKLTTQVFNPKTQQDEDVTKTQIAIFGSWRENPYLAPEYIAELRNITDENLRRAWEYGDWDVTAGGAFDDLWKVSVHRISPFRVPAGWRVDRSFDWGSSHPFSVGFWAEANGEEVILDDGTRFCPPRGTLIRIGEWYGSKQIGFNKGIKMSANDVAAGIRDREMVMMLNKRIPTQPWPGPADNQIRDVRESNVDTIEKKMADVGIRWTPSDKSKGSRKVGLQLMRDRLEASLRGEGPGIYFTTDCPAALTLLPSLPRDPDDLDDIDTDAEDHIWDEVRYRVLASSNRIATTLTASMPS